MPVYKDPERGTWYCKFRYTDWTGARKQKKKRGFARKQDAQAWEREFLEKESQSCDMTCKAMTDLYLEDCRQRLRATTMERKDNTFSKHLLPYFGSTPINQITPVQIRNWQNTMINAKQDNGKSFSKTYLHSVNNELSAIMNYAVKYYGLGRNPVHTAGSMGRKHAEGMLFWTEDEYKKFIAKVSDPAAYCVFNVLFYTGMREGEMLALRLDDFDFEKKIGHITKTFAHICGKDVIRDTKTPKSRRDVTLPDFLVEIVKDYASRLIDYEPDERLFPHDKSWVSRQMKRGCDQSGVKKIRVHDIRHSHASLLINMGFPILVISERLGHENIQTTLQLYSHLYPDVHGNVAKTLDEKSGSDLGPDAWKNHGPKAEN